MPLEPEIRVIVRAELASAFGMLLRRVQDLDPERPLLPRDLALLFGEGLRDFGGTDSEPGT